MGELSDIQGFVIDMDGVLWRGAQLMPGVDDFLELLRARYLPFVLVTNNASQTTDEVRGKLDVFGISIEAKDVLTSATGAAEFLLEQELDSHRVYVIGEPPLREAIKGAGFQIARRGDEVSAVVVGIDFDLRWKHLEQAAYALNNGAFFLGTNPDRSFPTEHGLAPGNGATLAALEAATGREPTIYGKPEPHLFRGALKRMGTKPEQTLALGDRLETDILGGQRAGLMTALVLTGVTDREALERSRTQPDWVFEDLGAVAEAIK